MDDPFKRPAIRTGLFYHCPEQAMAWLEAAFGLTKSTEVRCKSGNLIHAEMQFGACTIVIDAEWSDVVSSPLSLDGATTQIVYAYLEEGLDAHFAKAREHGAFILSEPEDQYYGDRLYRAKDPEGHIWTFSQAVGHVSRAEAERVGGVEILGWHDD